MKLQQKGMLKSAVIYNFKHLKAVNLLIILKVTYLTIAKNPPFNINECKHDLSEDRGAHRWSLPTQQVTYLQFVIRDRCQTRPMCILPGSLYCRE